MVSSTKDRDHGVILLLTHDYWNVVRLWWKYSGIEVSRLWTVGRKFFIWRFTSYILPVLGCFSQRKIYWKCTPYRLTKLSGRQSKYPKKLVTRCQTENKNDCIPKKSMEILKNLVEKNQINVNPLYLSCLLFIKNENKNVNFEARNSAH